MSIIRDIFGGGVVGQITDGIAKAKTAKADAVGKIMDAYAPFKLIQRFVVICIVPTIIVCFFLCLCYYIWAFSTGDTASANEFTQGVQLLLAAFKLDWSFYTIMLFLFASGATEGIIKKVREKK